MPAVATSSPPVVEQMKVEKGFEPALGAALGDDLDLPLDSNAPGLLGGIAPLSRRSGAAVGRGIACRLRQGAGCVAPRAQPDRRRRQHEEQGEPFAGR
jgi:hypothetical protein